ncbi:MAG: 5,10-methylenetetrahydrofolate reductase [Chloroflexi bacterium RBG_13_53_26]|nr:MAG: 5,10-methylenetetrahydrofolate reductase [Chloroflexi bacterium RBG_13_53_26]
MNLQEKLASNKFVVTTEIGPPKGVDISEMHETAEILKGRIDAVNCTDQQASVMRLGSLASCHLVKQWGLEPVFQMTCRDRNRIALQSDLLNAHVFGIENVLCLTGDHICLGDHPQAKPVFDLDSVSLLQALKLLGTGQDLGGKEVKGNPQYFAGACVTPGADPLEPQIIKMEKKVKAGAQFFQTQAVYEPRKFEEFMNAVKYLNVPVLLGIVLLRSAAMAHFMNKNVAGIHVPDSLIEEMDKAEKKQAKGIEIAARLIKDMKSMCQGVHIMAIGMEKRVPAILDAAGL